MRSTFFVLLVLGGIAQADMSWTEDFESGISPEVWTVFQADAQGVPWSVTAPHESALRLTKSADNDPSLSSPYAGIRSKFTLSGDFSVFVDFELPVFPLTGNAGANDALLTIIASNSGAAFESLRLNGATEEHAEAFTSLPPQSIGWELDSTNEGRFGITREGNTVAGWIDRGDGPALLGSMTHVDFSGPVEVLLWTIQQSNIWLSERPHTAMDIRFDNLTICADTISPDPAPVPLPGAVLLGMIGLGYAGYRLRRV